MRDVLSRAEVDEIADAPAGGVAQSVRIEHHRRDRERDERRTGVMGATVSAEAKPVGAAEEATIQQPKLEVKSVSDDGKVTFQARQN